jgi:hypothetical protein
MKLLDVRRYAIRKQMRVKFRTGSGAECVVNEKGISAVPGLNGPPDFNLEEELGKAAAFVVEPVVNEKGKARPRNVSRPDLEQMVAAVAPGAAHTAHDHDE